MNDYRIGIIGGMGPEATNDFYMKIIKATKAKKDQEHFHVVIDSNVKIPDRTEAILRNGENPVKSISQTAKNLELLGADVACIPCMTAHYFIEDVQQEVSYPILNAFKEVQRFIDKEYPEANKVGVLATTGTIKTGLFEHYLGDTEIIYPDSFSQEKKVMEAIYGKEGIKGGNTYDKPINLLKESASKLINEGAELLISGCTEIGMVLKSDMVKVNKPVVDPMKILAEVVVEHPFSAKVKKIK